MTPANPKLSRQICGRNRRCVQRLVRRLVFMLFGYYNFVNLYHKNHTAKQFEAYAKKRGMTVIPLGGVCAEMILDNTALNWMIDPLSDSKQEHTEKTKKGGSLWNEIELHGKTRNHAARTCDGESVPPMLQLKPGDRITHILISAKSPNASS